MHKKLHRLNCLNHRFPTLILMIRKMDNKSIKRNQGNQVKLKVVYLERHRVVMDYLEMRQLPLQAVCSENHQVVVYLEQIYLVAVYSEIILTKIVSLRVEVCSVSLLAAYSQEEIHYLVIIN